MTVISNNLFYQQYQANFFNLKQIWLKYLLENHKSIDFKSDHLSDINEKEILISIKSDIRQTYFQAIETVFEILFGLGPNDKGEFPQDVLKNISSQGFPYNRIYSISKDADELNYLDQELLIKGNRKISLGEYIFYFGLHDVNRYREDLTDSIIAIKQALFIISKDFSDRSEYNSYKHGLRIMPALRNLSILNAKSQKEEMSFSMSDSMTYYSYDKKKNETSFVTKLFDTDRDIRMTSVCSNIIYTMIKNRDFYLNNQDIDKKHPILFFGIDEIRNAAKTNVKIQNIVYSFKDI